MLTLNFTSVVALAVFLIFLRIASRIFWRPMIRHMVRRERLFAVQEESIQQQLSDAKALQERIQQRLDQKKKILSHDVDLKLQQAHSSRRLMLASEKNKTEQHLVQLHDQMQEYLETERRRFAEALPRLIEEMDLRFQQGGPHL
ncbi:MAG: F0F1 ATP synthase subunit B' [Candidatus Hydrogenedentes bacterium ADurb.Bin170]|jgi:F0F1-type ATP synthase membrane subunit b/b'|nr:MAG: F0F1 ATP synthase subunit B' [Candidatus Hydrogenedentes bacterium ADurb.Bin170]